MVMSVINAEKLIMDNIFIVTDSCMWEANRQNGTRSAHTIEVVDVETGQVRFIKSGSRIKFVEGEISDAHDQDEYNRQQDEFDAMKNKSE